MWLSFLKVYLIELQFFSVKERKKEFSFNKFKILKSNGYTFLESFPTEQLWHECRGTGITYQNVIYILAKIKGAVNEMPYHWLQFVTHRYLTFEIMKDDLTQYWALYDTYLQYQDHYVLIQYGSNRLIYNVNMTEPISIFISR